MDSHTQDFLIDKSGFTLKSLYRVGGSAALVAVLFAFIQIMVEIVGVGFMHIAVPTAVVDWFRLLQSHPLFGLTALTMFQIPTFILCVPVILVLYLTIRPMNRIYMLVATAFALLGIGVYLASNTVFSMYLLSGQYAAATTDVERSMALAAGQAMFAIYEGSGVDVGLFLFMISVLLISLNMFKSQVFSPLTAILGILAGAVGLIYYIITAFSPSAIFIYEFAGLLFVVWLTLVGLRFMVLANRVDI